MRRALPWLLGGLIAALAPTAASADDCSLSSTTLKCTGDLSSGVAIDASDDNFNEIEFKNLTADVGGVAITSDPGSNSSDGSNGNDTSTVYMTFDGSSSYGIVNNGGSAFDIDYTAGNGVKGESKSGTADDGGDGGSGATGSSLTITNTTEFTGDSTIDWVLDGGNGGEGGEGKTEAFESAHGGDGGDGGNGGGAVITVESGELTQMTANAGELIYVHSQGGDGGKGGEGRGESGTSTNVHGGPGGAGGDGEDVTIEITTTATSKVTADNISAIRLESLGGQGGDGGEAKGSGSSEVTNGGDGGDGGSGGKVELDFSTATIKTTGEQSLGVLVRSYGGAGGDGGSTSGGDSGSGGDGGGGGDSSSITVNFGGSIETSGLDSTGILLQSVGGFAGDAGSANDLLVTYGASDQSGGLAGVVIGTLLEGASIMTGGDGAAGLYVQSVGGGGGKGSNDTSLSSIGGTGSAGGNGGAVGIIVNSGVTIGTQGDTAPAVFAQSFGGGGGSGGSSEGISAIGGSSGSGGSGGMVTAVIEDATLSTSGDSSNAVLLSSSGGGGGVAQSTVGIVSVGGSGGDGGDGGEVILNIDGSMITTEGDDSDAIFMQSVGGGGGSGSNALALGVEFSMAVGGSGGSGGTGGTVEIDATTTDTGMIVTTGDRARGVVAQSIGGGGGGAGNAFSYSLGFALDVAVGQTKDGGDGNLGGNIIINEFYHSVQTSGDNAHGVLAQSVGGGGGSVGTNITYNLEIGAGAATTFGVGGAGGTGGGGGDVTITLNEAVTTGGNQAHAVFAQSVGGGGGSSGATLSGSAVAFDSFGVTAGGSGGAGGDGGKVTVVTEGDITTTGSAADGILAQSIGGGGGTAGWTSTIDGINNTAISLTSGGDGGDGGSADNVKVTTASGTKIKVSGDSSVGIMAQSVGGSGGDTDATVSGDIASSNKDMSFTTGGDGGGAGDPGNVTVKSYSDITTMGDNGYGIFAQSVANSGGSTAFTVDASLASVSSLSFTVSGSGGGGGNGGKASVTNMGTVTTSGDYAVGITAQSNGSGGGSASGTISVDALVMGSASVAVGGNGGSGGSGGEVTITNEGTVSTGGDYAPALFGQSVGGSGGTGGMVINAAFSSGSEVSADFDVDVGGSGGSGATSSTVTVDNSAELKTVGFQSHGIIAQSIGGSGGNGGSVYSGVLSFGADASFTGQVSVGGSGGKGGSSDEVMVDNSATIKTEGYGAAAIFAQAVGGSGGNGGSSFALTADASTDGSLALDLTVGGDGGGSSLAGEVFVENQGDLTTTLNAAMGIFAQSIGGNGGSGGSAGTILLDKTSGTSGGTLTVSSQVNLGGSGGDGGVAGSVEVDNYGTISTSGEGSTGIYAQSVGGGGGDGGLASAFTLTKIADSTDDDNSSFSASIAVGGTGGSGGDSDMVTVKNYNTITTEGMVAYGIFAQSVGGGGGNGGNGDIGSEAFVDALEASIESGDSSDAESAFDKDLATTETIAEDLYNTYSSISSLKTASAQSLLTTWEVDVGGSGGAAGDGNDVSVDNEAAIETMGDSATAIFAQSVGGGGGNGGDGTGSVLSQVSLSGDAGSASVGGDVSVGTTAKLTTSGDGAMGIFAQSVGGGGGTAGDVELAFSVFDSSTFGLGVSDSGSGGKGGDGGDVTVTTSAAITTTGVGAHGIWAQSVGGSGGAAGSSADTVVASVTGSGGSAGDGGKVKVTVGDAISVTGDSSVAVFAQSVSGDDSSSSSAAVTVELVGAEVTVGDNGQGIVAQSDGASSSGKVTVSIDSDSSVSVGESGAEGDGSYGVLVLGGSGKATITVDGTVEMSSVDDVALGSLLSADTTTIDLNGTVFGSISSAFVSEISLNSGSLLEIGTTMALGTDAAPGALYLEGGTLSPGGSDNIITTSVSGGVFVYDPDVTDTTFLLDLEMGDGTTDGSSDVLNFSFDGTSKLATYLYGELEVNLTGTNLLTSGESGSVTIATVDSGLTLVADSLTVEDTSTVDYTLTVGSTDLTLTYSVDYTPSAENLSENQNSVGDYVSTLTAAAGGTTTGTDSDAGGPAAASAAPGTSDNFVNELAGHLLRVTTLEELQQIYDLLGPGEIFATAQTTVLSSLRFDDKLHSCPQIGADGMALFFDEGSCAWGDFYGVYSSRGEEPNSASYDERVFGFAAGAQQRLEDGWILGAAFSYERSNLSATDYSGDGHRVQAGAVVKKEFGATTLAGSFSGGFGTYDSTRTLYTPNSNTPSQATSDPSNFWIAGHARLAHRFEVFEATQVKPYMDLGVWQFWQGAYSESSGDPYALDIDGFSSTAVTANPMVEVQTAFRLGGVALDAGVRGGVLGFLTSRQISTQARLQGVGVAGPWFDLQDDDSRIYGQIGSTLKGQVTDYLTAEASFDTLLSQNSSEYIGSARLNLHF